MPEGLELYTYPVNIIGYTIETVHHTRYQVPDTSYQSLCFLNPRKTRPPVAVHASGLVMVLVWCMVVSDGVWYGRADQSLGRYTGGLAGQP